MINVLFDMVESQRLETEIYRHLSSVIKNNILFLITWHRDQIVAFHTKLVA